MNKKAGFISSLVKAILSLAILAVELILWYNYGLMNTLIINLFFAGIVGFTSGARSKSHGTIWAVTGMFAIIAAILLLVFG